MKVVYFGTSSFACPSLYRLVRHPSFEVTGVVTQPDRPRGRAGKLTPPPVKQAALDLHCKVFQPETLSNSAFISQLKYLRPDFIVVAAYGKILPKNILELPPKGCFNIHGSLLPQYRGAAPIQRAIMDGGDETGVTIMRMDEKLDTGDILLRQSTHIRGTDNYQTLHDRLAELGGILLAEALTLVTENRAVFSKQNPSEATYAAKITREDELIRWDASKRQVWNQIRALYPGPGAYCYVETDKGPKLVKLLTAEFERFVKGKPGEIVAINKEGIHVAANRGAVVIKELQLEGKKKMSAGDFLRGCPLETGQHFLSTPPKNEEK
ncbi:MAG: methionyl-tRNA formyltransferase [Verrucomicrobiae bacterium]|nr:methionyl-tRNA formyltransferase [Verrucomicrobiae bacterium]